MKKLFLALAMSAAMIVPAMAHNHRDHDEGWRGYDHHRGFFHEFQGRHRWFDVDPYWRFHADPYFDGYVLGPDEEFFPDGRCVEESRIDEDGNEVRWVRCYR